MDILTLTGLLITNRVLAWVGLRLVKRVDQLDQKVDDYETRLQLTEHQINTIKEA